MKRGDVDSRLVAPPKIGWKLEHEDDGRSHGDVTPNEGDRAVLGRAATARVAAADGSAGTDEGLVRRVLLVAPPAVNVRGGAREAGLRWRGRACRSGLGGVLGRTMRTIASSSASSFVWP